MLIWKSHFVRVSGVGILAATLVLSACVTTDANNPNGANNGYPNSGYPSNPQYPSTGSTTTYPSTNPQYPSTGSTTTYPSTNPQYPSTGGTTTYPSNPFPSTGSTTTYPSNPQYPSTNPFPTIPSVPSTGSNMPESPFGTSPNTGWQVVPPVGSSEVIISPAPSPNYVGNGSFNGNLNQTGVISWYGQKFHGTQTASGEKFDMYDLTAAHPSLPYGSLVNVTNLDNNQTVQVRINDRTSASSRNILEVSYAAAARIGMLNTASANARTDVKRYGTNIAVTNGVPDFNGGGRGDNTNYPPVPAPYPPMPSPYPPVPLPPAPVPRPPQPPQTVGAGSWLQTGAFSARANADKLAGRLSSQGYSPVQVMLLPAGNTQLWRVRLGPYATQAVAQKNYDKLVRDGYRVNVVRK